ncbi:MAG: hypothetical protein AAF787_02215 [Chloroflexota bacterium]
MSVNKVQVYWHRYGRVLVQRFSGSVSYLSLANAINKIECNITGLQGHLLPNVIIDMTNRSPDMDMSIFTFADLRRLLPHDAQVPCGMNVIIVDRDPGYAPIQRLAAMLHTLGYAVLVTETFEQAIDEVELNNDAAAAG